MSEAVAQLLYSAGRAERRSHATIQFPNVSYSITQGSSFLPSSSTRAFCFRMRLASPANSDDLDFRPLLVPDSPWRVALSKYMPKMAMGCSKA